MVSKLTSTCISLALAMHVSTLPAVAAQFPEARISNGIVSASLYLPDAERGYYRGARFDWSGVISRLEYAGHNYFGVWFPHYEPTLHDAIVGPVEEFRAPDGAVGFSAAAPGQLFIKPGVGALRKPDNEPYAFTRPYPIISTGTWIVRPFADRIEFVQQLPRIEGYGYTYTKVVRLAKGKPELILEHTLKNTGKLPIRTAVYNHDFYVIDGQPTGPAFTIRFPFTPKAEDDLHGAAEIRGNELKYLREIPAASQHASVATGLTGFGSDARDYDIRVENSAVHAGVQQTANRPISKFYLWSIRTTVCPEAYIALDIPPKNSAKWRITYRFYTLPEQPGKKAKHQ